MEESNITPILLGTGQIFAKEPNTIRHKLSINILLYKGIYYI